VNNDRQRSHTIADSSRIVTAVAAHSFPKLHVKPVLALLIVLKRLQHTMMRFSLAFVGLLFSTKTAIAVADEVSRSLGMCKH
jgi:hypothetical protein